MDCAAPTVRVSPMAFRSLCVLGGDGAVGVPWQTDPLGFGCAVELGASRFFPQLFGVSRVLS